MCAAGDDENMPIVDVGALVRPGNLVLCCKIWEAALHSLPLTAVAKGGSDNVLLGALTSSIAVVHAVAKAAAQALGGGQRTAAAAGASSSLASSSAAGAAGSSQHATLVAPPVFSQMVAALKYAPVCGGRAGTAALFLNRLGVVVSVNSASLRILQTHQEAAAPAAAPLPQHQQLVWFHLLGRCLIAAGSLLEQVPMHVPENGECVGTGSRGQVRILGAALRLLVISASHMHSMLSQGGAAASAVAAGTAGATPDDLPRLLQQAADLQQQLVSIYRVLNPHAYNEDGGWAVGNNDTLVVVSSDQQASAMRNLRAACASGDLLQQLTSFGVACCSAFPQPGVCGNPACLNLDKFSEAALATRGCSGCNKVRLLVMSCGSHRCLPIRD
jgi:hypothetical protein